MAFDAHDRAFAFFKGTWTRSIYDNMKTAAETIFVGKEIGERLALIANIQPLMRGLIGHSFLAHWPRDGA